MMLILGVLLYCRAFGFWVLEFAGFGVGVLQILVVFGGGRLLDLGLGLDLESWFLMSDVAVDLRSWVWV